MGPSIWQLLIVLVIIIIIFGSKKLKNLGSDLGGAFKGFKSAMSDEEKKAAEEQQGRIIEGEASESTDSESTASKEKENS